MEILNRYSQNIPKTVQQDRPIGTSKLGTPVYADIIFKAGSYEGPIDGQTINFPQVQLQAVLMDVSQAKVIIKTEIAGRNGTVKEYIGLGDYQISISGIITGDNGVRPVQEISDLRKMLNAPVPIQVASSYLQEMGIDSLVVETYDMPELEGGRSYQTFQINCSSDIPQELRLTDV
jgi:hypothetical protein